MNDVMHNFCFYLRWPQFPSKAIMPSALILWTLTEAISIPGSRGLVQPRSASHSALLSCWQSHTTPLEPVMGLTKSLNSLQNKSLFTLDIDERGERTSTAPAILQRETFKWSGQSNLSRWHWAHVKPFLKLDYTYPGQLYFLGHKNYSKRFKKWYREMDIARERLVEPEPHV